MRPVLSLPPASPSLLASLVGLILATWIATIGVMRGMDAGPGTPLGEFGWFVGSWILMMTAMMLPSEMRFALVFAQLAREHDRHQSRFASLWLFLSGYFLVWAAYGVLAFVVDWSLRPRLPAFFAWDQYGPILAGATLMSAGLYQLSPLKHACLRHCMSPLSFFLHRWRSGAVGALRMGVEHGLLCVGCCWGLMLVMFALGVMSLWWMLLLTLVMFVEKVTPWGAQLARPVAVGLMLLGLWVAVAPETVPGLTAPHSVFHTGTH